MRFDELQQDKHRAAYIEEAQQKAWGAACHADWIAQGLDVALAQYKELEGKASANLEEQKKLKDALDSHTEGGIKDIIDRLDKLEAKP